MKTDSTGRINNNKPTVIICPGNGCTNIRASNWYGRFSDELTKRGIPNVCENFPDPNQARRSIWVPFIRSKAEEFATCSSADPSNVILVGHSSGAQATLIRAAILVAATYTDLGDAHERASGYYPQQPSSNGGETNPYRFDKMKQNCPLWYQFHSDDDPFIPLREAERIRDGLGLTTDTTHYYRMLPGRSHFFDYFPELLEVVSSLC